MKTNGYLALSFACLLSSLALADGAMEFCLDGELDLGARYQGTKPEAGEFYPTTWCVVTEDDSQRVLFSGSGKSNPDMHGSWTVAYLPPDTVRIVNRESPPDVEFRGVDILAEALRVRRVDPRRLLAEFRKAPASVDGLQVNIHENRVLSVGTSATLPLRGQVSVDWNWDWTDENAPELNLIVDDTLLSRRLVAGANWELTQAQRSGRSPPLPIRYRFRAIAGRQESTCNSSNSQTVSTLSKVCEQVFSISS